MIRASQDLLHLYRPIEIDLPIDMAIAQKNITRALQNDLVLSKKYQLTRYYWGHGEQNKVRLVGPRAMKQFCFRFEGKLTGGDRQTKLIGTLRLRNQDFHQVAFAALLITVFLSALLRWGAITVMPLFLGFLYGMVQWHFQCYAKEYQHILTSLLSGEKPTLIDLWGN
ncbi:hypothetical protein [[Limnothrix rosea] IAM M-220]|uniref:hypothetical protein n=1 Tax=[Limnothrix rosea] IAM M-220 TaxID=454133 RepID=UPI00095B7412|nr:hypothetical protein [[Limnothrix rosea] IAM M-220]OKH17614.1 hypothetical protein NIES208_08900 [[Limnothrix rosea] IAM M-220]